MISPLSLIQNFCVRGPQLMTLSALTGLLWGQIIQWPKRSCALFIVHYILMRLPWSLPAGAHLSSLNMRPILFWPPRLLSLMKWQIYARPSAQTYSKLPKALDLISALAVSSYMLVRAMAAPVFQKIRSRSHVRLKKPMCRSLLSARLLMPMKRASAVWPIKS